jgi:uncharacterized membrane protein YidH (DUF202 family)
MHYLAFGLALAALLVWVYGTAFICGALKTETQSQVVGVLFIWPLLLLTLIGYWAYQLGLKSCPRQNAPHR